MLSPTWRNRLFAAGAAAIALWVGTDIARGFYFLPGLLATALLLFLLAQWRPLPLGATLLAAVLFGYVVGNRGFAQLMLSPRFPLLPAEGVLLFTGAVMVVQSAWRHELPFHRDPLHLLVLAWIVYGAARVVFDFRLFGFMAVRDFATVYYALYFFVACEVARQRFSSRALLNVLLVSCVVMAGTAAIDAYDPTFFARFLTVRGAPVIFYKGDLVGIYLAVASVLCFLRFEEHGRRWYVVLSLALAAGVLATNNRASLVALLVAAGWLAIRRRWRYAAWLGASGATAAVFILVAAAVMNTSWEKTPLFGVYERVISLADPAGQRSYRGANTSFKGDNNLFRTVWWRAVAAETIDVNPYVGLGFGHDLAARFVREYYPESGEEFSTRSPHNILLTVFARMGGLGLVLFLSIISMVAARTWHAVRASPVAAAPWCAVWMILTAACFGVVLEGPMGAVVFWTMLGLAAANDGSGDDPLATTEPRGAAPDEPAATIGAIAGTADHRRGDSVG